MEQWKVGDVVWFADANDDNEVACAEYQVEAVLDSKLVQLRSLCGQASLRFYPPHLLRRTKNSALSAFIEHEGEQAHLELTEALRKSQRRLQAVAGAMRLCEELGL